MARIVIVDDHPLVRQGLAQLLDQEEGIEVCGEASNASEAMKLVSSARPDLAVVDLSLGSEDGIALIERLRNVHPTTQILVLSMHAEGSYAERCIKAGAKGYVMKESPPSHVVAAVRKVLQGGIYLSEEMSDRLLRRIGSSQPRMIASPIELLSNREFSVFRLLGAGLRTREIADALNLSVKTIETHIDRIKKKMDLRDSRDVVVRAVAWMQERGDEGETETERSIGEPDASKDEEE